MASLKKFKKWLVCLEKKPTEKNYSVTFFENGNHKAQLWSSAISYR